MGREWSTEDLVASWTLIGDDWQLVGNKTGTTRLAFALILKFFEIEARFPRAVDEFPSGAVAYVAEQVKVDPGEFALYRWTGRTVEYHRAQIRDAFGFREFTRADEDKLADWLATEVCPVELRDEQLREALVVRCRGERLEPPGRIERIIRSARATFDQQFCDRTVTRLGVHCADRLEDLADRPLLAELKADPGQVGLETLLREIDKLTAIRYLRLPADLFVDASEKLVEGWRARAARSYPSDLRAAPRTVRLTLLAALCWVRSAEITDALVDLLIGLVHKINARADRRVERELIDELRRVRGKEAILFRLAEAAVEHPDDTVREALYPVVSEKTLRELVREAKANQQAFQARVRTVLRGSYSSYYRRMLPALLSALEFRCNNTAYRPIMDALDLLARYAERRRQGPFLRPDGSGTARRGGASRVAGGGARRPRPGRTHPVRAVRVDRVTGCVAPQGTLRRRREPVAQPGRRPARRLRHCSRGALRRAAAADGPHRIHHQSPAAHE